MEKMEQWCVCRVVIDGVNVNSEDNFQGDGVIQNVQDIYSREVTPKMIQMAVILMNLLHKEILLRLILLSNVTFEFVLIFCRQFARFSPFLVGLVR